MEEMQKELKRFRSNLKRDVENLFKLRSKHPTRHYIPSRDKRYPYRIIEHGRDITPLPHIIPGLTYMDDEELHATCKEMFAMAHELFNRPEEPLKANIQIKRPQDVIDMISKRDSLIKRLDVWYSPEQLSEWETKRKLKNVPSMYRLREDPPRVTKELREIPVRLEETSTFVVFDIMSHVAPEGSEQAVQFEENKNRIKALKIRHKFLVIYPYSEAFTQTFGPITRNESTLRRAPERDNACVDVNDSEMVRTFIELGVFNFKRRTSLLTSLMPVKAVSADLRKPQRLTRFKMFEKNNKTPKELEWLESLEFLKCATVVERILTANIFSNLQFMYHERLYSKKPVDDFQYIPQLLWTCSCARTYGKAVTCISWCRSIPEVFLVSYGKYLFEKKTKNGLVCLWNVKNTEFPERMAILPEPVTYVEFSEKYPRLAGVSFWDGTVGLMDMVLREPELLVKSSYTLGLLHPIWQIKWFMLDGDELLLTCGENGSIHSFEVNRKFQFRKILTVRRVGNVVRKGITMPQGNPSYDRCTLSPAIMFMVQYPKDEKIIMVATDQGYVQVFSIYKPREPLDVFGAHAGPITTIEFNPVDCRIFLTAGCDYYIRIWGYDIYETYLLQLKYRLLYVDYAAWSPAHPYMIVGLCGCYIDVWNIKKLYHEPVNSIENPYKNRNLIVSFNPTGANFLVGDMEGFVFVYSFTSIPKPPEDPLLKLAEALLLPLSFDDRRLRLMALKLGYPFIPDKEKLKRLFTAKES